MPSTRPHWGFNWEKPKPTNKPYYGVMVGRKVADAVEEAMKDLLRAERARELTAEIEAKFYQKLMEHEPSWSWYDDTTDITR